ncbi:unnamed protein product [Arctogadus glacialis]
MDVHYVFLGDIWSSSWAHEASGPILTCSVADTDSVSRSTAEGSRPLPERLGGGVWVLLRRKGKVGLLDHCFVLYHSGPNLKPEVDNDSGGEGGQMYGGYAVIFA